MLNAKLTDQLVIEAQIFLVTHRFNDALFKTLNTLLIDIFYRRQLHRLNLLIGRTFNRLQHAPLTRRYKQDRITFTARTTCTTDTVNVRFSIVWNIVVKHVTYTWHVETTCYYVSCNQQV